MFYRPARTILKRVTSRRRCLRNSLPSRRVRKQFPVFLVISPTGGLDLPSSFEPLAVARLGVTEFLRILRDWLVTALRAAFQAFTVISVKVGASQSFAALRTNTWTTIF
jgi:hypothetical protein